MFTVFCLGAGFTALVIGLFVRKTLHRSITRRGEPHQMIIYSRFDATKIVYENAALVTLRGADLHGADLRGADLRGADLRGADLRGADLHGAYLRGADLRGADLHGADLRGADLRWADLSRADLRWANLSEARLHEAGLHGAELRGATMPDGRTFEAYAADPLAGICQDAAARDRAVAAWGNHSWEDCPVHAAMGYNGVDDAPADTRLAVAAFVALFDGVLLPAPRPVSP
jgi:hypothetical protein